MGWPGPGSMRKALASNRTATSRLTELHDPRGKTTRTPDGARKVVADFYNQLYQCHLPRTSPHMAQEEDVPPILVSEVEREIRKLKPGRSPGPDQISPEMLLTTRDLLAPQLTRLFNSILEEEVIPDHLAYSLVILLFKTGEPLDIRNYRPIALFSMVFKLFTSILGNRMIKTLETNQPPEQAGFRKGFSTSDHILVLNEMIQRCEEDCSSNFTIRLLFPGIQHIFIVRR